MNTLNDYRRSQDLFDATLAALPDAALTGPTRAMAGRWPTSSGT